MYFVLIIFTQTYFSLFLCLFFCLCLFLPERTGFCTCRISLLVPDSSSSPLPPLFILRSVLFAGIRATGGYTRRRSFPFHAIKRVEASGAERIESFILHQQSIFEDLAFGSRENAACLRPTLKLVFERVSN